MNKSGSEVKPSQKPEFEKDEFRRRQNSQIHRDEAFCDLQFTPGPLWAAAVFPNYLRYVFEMPAHAAFS
ncbi:hypothetical protein L1987_70586 [Smallanthus sonchifolius]|uniref:Uncharacterized protein n=1 Tax=Smallanthus sonchifolius TaxID=185202 RepID=A0ACB9APG1_9ASTR|nr:hypothetical protein L1987_70586 [Smallanthus sonchifolius]